MLLDQIYKSDDEEEVYFNNPRTNLNQPSDTNLPINIQENL